MVCYLLAVLQLSCGVLVNEDCGGGAGEDQPVKVRRRELCALGCVCPYTGVNVDMLLAKHSDVVSLAPLGL